jgi:hypothetical protein
MHRVELIGPPGVGKTTIFRAACDVRVRPGVPFWRTQEFQARGFYSGWSEFQALIGEAYAGCPEDDNIHIRRRDATFDALRMARKITAAKGDDLVLCDESLCQRGLSLALSRPGSSEWVCKYFDNVPLPSAVVVLTAPREVIEARNAERGENGGRDRSADNAATLAACAIAVTQLCGRGADIVEIDATPPIDVCVSELVAGLERLACSP